MPKFSKCEQVEKVACALVKAGWTEVSRNKHAKLVSPCGHLWTTVSISPSDGRAALNWISDLRRSGVDLKKLMTPKRAHKKEHPQ